MRDRPPTLRELTPCILYLLDKGHTPVQIAALLRLPRGRVYTALRLERSSRKRARISPKPLLIKRLLRAGLRASRVAELLEVTVQYVYLVMLPARRYTDQAGEAARLTNRI